MKLGILKEFDNRHEDYIKACEALNVDYEVIDIINSNWVKHVKNCQCDGFLVRPSSANDVRNRMYDERVYYINKVMGLPIYPSYDEVYLYENKRNMAYWLEINEIPSPKTWVFYNKKEAVDFVNSYDNYPLVFKPNIGSAGIGVRFINSKKAINLINKTFTKWKFFNLGFTKWYKTKYKISYPQMDDKQFNNILFQERVNVKYEWRGIKIGNSYFAHKKLEGKSGLHSGSGEANYDTPPIEVMNFIKYVCDVGGFSSMNVDFFEDYEGEFHVNELQTTFGSKIKPYEMCVNNKPGRYIYVNNNWVFEEGMFNQNKSFNLRVKDFLVQLSQVDKF